MVSIESGLIVELCVVGVPIVVASKDSQKIRKSGRENVIKI